MPGPFAICFLFKASQNYGYHELTALKENGNVALVFTNINIDAIIQWGYG